MKVRTREREELVSRFSVFWSQETREKLAHQPET